MLFNPFLCHFQFNDDAATAKPRKAELELDNVFPNKKPQG